MGKSKLAGDVILFAHRVATEFGQLSLQEGDLVGERGESFKYNYRLIDELSADLGIAATVFIKEGDDFRRISTSIVDKEGKRAVDTFLGTGSAAYPAIRSGQSYSGQAVILGNNYLTVYKPILAGNGKDVIGILFIGNEMTVIEKVIAENTVKQVKLVSIIAIVILLVVFVANTLSYQFIIIKPIKAATEMLKEIAQGEGDLTTRLAVSSNDEIGDMAVFFNQSLDKIKRVVVDIKKEAVNLSTVGGDLSSNMNQTATAVNEITGYIQNIKNRIINQSASVNEANASMEQVVANINRLNGHVENQSNNINQASSAIEEMAANINSVASTLNNNAANVKTLKEASEVGRGSLQEVVTDIQEIARESEGLFEINAVMENISSQTNLLSMNAAIEAAHAGEAGKGFAVVAGEIRKLAESSSAQSKTIGNVLKKIKNSIDKITRSTENVLNKFEAIDSGVRTVSAQEEAIRNAMEKQSDGSKQLLRTAGTLGGLTQQVKSGSEEMLVGSKEVIRESQNLEKVTHEISSGMNEISSSAEQVNTAINHVHEISDKTHTGITSLLREVSIFKVE
jgi:methyl-accepting chemotaxis protein